MQPDTTVNLGDFEFADTEVPAKIPFGGSQALAVHKLIGGTRVIDAMGPDDDALEWSGLFFGQNATERALSLEAMRVAGLQQSLTWGKFSYSVIVKEFHADYERFYQIPYRISCEVVANLTTPVTTGSSATVDTAINGDAATATQLSV